MIFWCYKNCSTCKRAKEFLDSNNINYEYREIKETPPTIHELNELIDLSGKDISKFFNTSGNSYKELNIKEIKDKISNKEKLVLLSNDGMLIKRPIFRTKDRVFIGFKEKEWEELL